MKTGRRTAASGRLRAALAAVVVCSTMALAAAAIAAPAWPTHHCGSFKKWIPGDQDVPGVWYRLDVLNGGVSCRTAVKVIRTDWTAGKTVHHGGPSDAQSWWTLKGLPGWRCREGASAGSCTRGNSIAAYEVTILQ